MSEMSFDAPEDPPRPMTRILRTDSRRLGEIITQYTNVTEADINEALERAKETGLSLGEQLYRDGRLTDDDRAKCLSVQWGMPYLDLSRSRVSRKAIHLIDHNFQRQNKVLAVQLRDNVLTMAIIDPLNVDVLDDIRVITGFDVKPVVVSESALQNKQQEVFDENAPVLDELEEMEEEDVEEEPHEDVLNMEDGAVSNIVEDAARELDISFESASSVMDQDVHNLNAMAAEMPIIRLVDSILAQGIQKGASDIHFQCEADCLQVRYRVDGILHDGPKVPKQLMRVVAARVRVMANLDVSAKRTPQDGRVTLRAGSRTFEMRVSILPCVTGPKIVMRVVEAGGANITMEQMGFSPEVLATFDEMIYRPYGIILITGPTGSGKSTTLYAAVDKLNNNERNILTVEDPVELHVHGISQAEINERAGLTFAGALRAALRQDPDIIMVGEIRDQETAMIAIHASLTGHMVLSTLHTNDAPSAVTRLVDMGVESFLVASSMIGALAQRLARRVCPECAEDFVPTPKELAPLGLDADDSEAVVLKRSKGCDLCDDTGYKGRIGIYELLSVTDSIKHLVLEGVGDAIIREKAVEEGMNTLVKDVASKLVQGITTLEEAQRIVFF